MFSTMLDPILMSKALSLVALTVCPVQPAPDVDVRFAAEKPFYSEKYDSPALKKNFRNDKESTLMTDDRSMLLGITSSMTNDAFHISFKTLQDQGGNTCIYFDRATFIITYYPAVFISSDVKDLPCSYKVTREHEGQHVAIDILAIQEYIPRIKMDMLRYLQTLGYQGFGPYSPGEAAEKQKELSRQIMAASKPMAEKLREARRQRQGEIDTVENYRREAAKCPGDERSLAERHVRALHAR